MKNLKNLILAVVFAAFVSVSFGQVGLVIEKKFGDSVFWTAVARIDKGGEAAIVLRTTASAEKRLIPESEFLVVPPKGSTFKLAQFDGKGKFLPVDLVNANGKLYWAIVDSLSRTAPSW